MKKKKQNLMLLTEAMKCLYAASQANKESEMEHKLEGIEIAFHFKKGHISVVSIEKGKGESVERSHEVLHPEEDFEDSGENTYGLLN